MGKPTAHAPPVARRRAAHLGPERRRPLVLDAAFRLFLERGYEGTSMEAIAEAAGVTKPVVYACYPSKERLFGALLAREEERILTQIQAAFAATDLDDPEAALREGFTGFLRAVTASPEVYRIVFLGEGGGNAAIAARIQRGRQAQVDAIAELARRWLGGRAPAAVPGVDAEAAALALGHVIVGMAEAGARMLLGGEGGWEPETLGRFLARLAVGGQAALDRSASGRAD